MKIKSIEIIEQNLCLLINTEIDFEQFNNFADSLCQAIDCTVIERQWGADRHQWLLDFEGTRLELHYEFYSQACWLTVADVQDLDVLQYLAQLLRPFYE
ncbi:DUF3630 family protein [Shewanella marina]|uniref:DUF3630 family protein n=1 Tax=Shewanella marina TaxID=487319 RepID=UPI0004722F90|nr:DUF3630 family protein [Shewanella marina]